LIVRDGRKRLEVRFTDSSETIVSLRLEGNSLDKYRTTLINLLSFLLSQEAFQQESLSSFIEKTGKKIDSNGVFLEALHKQGEVLSNILKVIREFRDIGFSSKDVKKRYEERIGKPIRLSTIATYLMRLHDRGFLLRRKIGKEYVYQAAPPLLRSEQ